MKFVQIEELWLKILREFTGKGWTVSGLNKLRKLRNTGSTIKHHGNGRPDSARTDDNVASVKELI